MNSLFAYAIMETRIYYRSGSDPVENRRIIPMSVGVSRVQALSSCCDFALAIRDHDLVVGSDKYEIVEIVSGYMCFAHVAGEVVASCRYQLVRRIVA